MTEKGIGKDVEGRNHGLIKDISQYLHEETKENHKQL
jgi:hypothetical protein